MKIGITGAAGGIGSIVSQNLYDFGFDVVLVDNLSTGSLTNFPNNSFTKKVRILDLKDFANVELSLHDCEIVIHLSAISSLAHCQINPYQAFNENVGVTANLCKLSTKFGNKIIFSSTSAVYEGIDKKIYAETENLNPTLVYPHTKLAAERVLRGFHTSNSLRFITLRLFNVFGPNQDIRRINPPLINYIIREIAQGRNPIIYAPLTQKRDYIHINDIVDLIRHIILNHGRYFLNTEFNCGSGKGISILEILKSIEIGLGKKIEPIFSEPNLLWENFSELHSGFLPINSEIVKMETLKNSIADTRKTCSLLEWSSKSDVLEEIKNSSQTIFLKALNLN